MADTKLKIYGADWCSLTTRTLEHLKKIGVPFDYIDVEADEAASKWVKDQNGGKEKKPTVDLGGKVMTNPSNAQLDAALREAGLLN